MWESYCGSPHIAATRNEVDPVATSHALAGQSKRWLPISEARLRLFRAE